MAPCPVSWMLVGAVLLACHISTATAGSVIGIDFGSEFLKIALVKPGVPLDIVLTPEGKRKENTMVGFYDGEQLLGLPAENMVRLLRDPSRPCSRDDDDDDDDDDDYDYDYDDDDDDDDADAGTRIRSAVQTELSAVRSVPDHAQAPPSL
jgi:hypothetical protein